jgi:uncharacterized lipoprotein
MQSLKLIAALVAAVLIAGCSTTQQPQQPQSEQLLGENSCVRHCNLNYSACLNTANSPEARQECHDTRAACLQGC